MSMHLQQLAGSVKAVDSQISFACNIDM